MSESDQGAMNGWEPAYRGSADGHIVTVGGQPLAPRNDLVNYSPEFGWGSDKRGGMQLAAAILVDHLERAGEGIDLAVEMHHEFRERVIGRLPRFMAWEIPASYVAGWLRGMQEKAR